MNRYYFSALVAGLVLVIEAVRIYTFGSENLLSLVIAACSYFAILWLSSKIARYLFPTT